LACISFGIVKINNQYFAILTGDIVKSSKLKSKDREKLSKILLRTSKYLKDIFAYNIPSNIDIFRGDSWQLFVTKPEISLRIALMLRAFLKIHMKNPKIDTRIAIGIGTIDFVQKNKISSGDGEAFRISGLHLEEMPKEYNITIAFSENIKNNLTKSLDIISKLIDYHIKNWTIQQARAVSGALRNHTQKQIAKDIFQSSITQQAVADHLNKAGWTYIQLALDFYEESVRNLL